VKHRVVVTVEVPDEAPAAVAESVLKALIDINEHIGAEAQEHYPGLGIQVEGHEVEPD
jgi:small-conductance mechanosensitive channel